MSGNLHDKIFIRVFRPSEKGQTTRDTGPDMHWDGTAEAVHTQKLFELLRCFWVPTEHQSASTVVGRP